MRSGLLVLPFLAILVGAIGSFVGSSFPEIPWLSALSWSMSAAILVLWFLLDFENFIAFFRRKGTKYGASSGVIVLLVLLIIIGIGVLTVRPRFNKSYDATKSSLNTLSDQSLKIINKLKSEKIDIKIVAFFDGDQTSETFKDLIHLYESKGALFSIEYIDPQRERTRAIAEKITSSNTVIFRLGERESRLTTFNEEKITNALVNVLKATKKKIYFTKGHGEGEIKGQEAEGFAIVVESLQSNKYDVSVLNLLESPKVPEDADLVIVAGPQYDFKPQELTILEDYLKNGGALLVMIDATKPVVIMNSMIEKFGVRLQNDFLALSSNDPNVQHRYLSPDQVIVTEFDQFNAVTKDFAKQSGVAMLMQSARSLEDVPTNPNSMKTTMVAKTANSVVQVKDVKTVADLKNLKPEKFSVTSSPVIAVSVGKSSKVLSVLDKTAEPIMSIQKEGQKEGEDKKANTSKEKFKEIRLIVAGSSQFARNAGVQYATGNLDMFMNMVSYLLQDDDFISIRPKDPEKTTIKLTTGWSQLSLLIIAFVYPFAFLGSGIISWLRRRKE